MADVQIRIDPNKLRSLAFTSEGTRQLVDEKTRKVASTAESLSAGFRTGLYHRDHKSPGVGNTQPKYGKDARIMGKSAVGIVYTGNYAAMKDNHENNTLLKARG